MIYIRVLVVDDDIIVCRGLKKLIPWSELDSELVGEAENGEEAYKLALVEYPDLIITDIRMPVMDGLELCKKVHETMADTSIILLSAHEDFEYARTAIKYGVKSYILKPIDREKINQLKENIGSISEEFNKKKSFYSDFYNTELEKKFYEALKTSDQSFFTEFFEKQLPAFSITNSQVKEICTKIINILFDYLKSIGFGNDSIALSKENIMNDLFSRKTRTDIESYTQQIYLDVLQFTAKKKYAHSDSLITYVKNYINENFSDCNFSVTDMADRLNISNAYLSMIFRDGAGVNMSIYITDLRIEKACELLKNPGLKMTDVCTEVGYYDAHYFAKVFKKIKGVTPSEYRNLAIGEKKNGE